ncbi:MAG: Cache 3/Cache 2 fusion domain-containing protein, partial [Pseudomonadota bacterium]
MANVKSLSGRLTIAASIVFGLATIASVAALGYINYNKQVDEAQARQASSLAVAAAIWDASSDEMSVTFGADGQPQRVAWTGEPAAGGHEVVDRIGSITGETTTIFAFEQANGDFWRRTTNIVKPDGNRAVGTKLGKGGAVYPVIMAGQTFRGTANILGKDYSTIYFPIYGQSGNVEGILYVGVTKAAILWQALLDTTDIALLAVLGWLLAVFMINSTLRRSLAGLLNVREAITAVGEGKTDISLAETASQIAAATAKLLAWRACA